MRLYKQWNRPINVKTVSSNPTSTRIVVAYPRPALTKWTDYGPISFDQEVQVFQDNASYKIRKIEIPRSMVAVAPPGSSEVPRNPLTRWDVSSIPANNGIFLTKKLKNKIKMSNGWRTIKSLKHKFQIRLHSRREKGMAESFSREKIRHAPQKEGG